MEDLQLTVYCAASTVAELIGKRMGPRREGRISREKPWKERIDRKIALLRSQIAIMTNYVNGVRSRRLNRKVRRITQEHNRHSRYEQNDHLPNRILDTLKQKLNVQSTKRSKYITSENRRNNNNLFRTNEKGFYRGLKDQRVNDDDNLPDEADTESFWASLWSSPEQHNQNASWITHERHKYENLPDMAESTITMDNFKSAITKTHNWKAPGPDGIHNFWYKRFNFLHQKIVDIFNRCLEDPESFSSMFAEGITYLLPKGKSFEKDPSKGRPITCLCTIYKILTSCINNVVYEHLSHNNIINEEQKGCIRAARGCKEQLTIDQVILEQAHRRKRNVNVAYIDYRKAFDSLPHSWLIEVLRIYKIHQRIVNFVSLLMNNWRTRIIVRGNQKVVKTNPINIRRGIYQGDCLSALWFCLALNPLSNLLNSTNYGYKLNSNTPDKINHLLYMDDLKLYASTKVHLNHLLEMVSMFSKDICMTFGLEKCKMLSVIRGKVTSSSSDDEPFFQELMTDDTYKYLGIMQNRRFSQKIVKEQLTGEFKARLTRICKSYLTGGNTIKAINTYAISILTYSFGVIKWSMTELNSFQRQIRTTLTRFNKHHPKSCIERSSLPRRLGGKGLIDICYLHDNQIQALRQYFYGKQDTCPLIRAIVNADDQLTPLNLRSDIFEIQSFNQQQRLEMWSQKPLHGRFYNSLNNDMVDKALSSKWLVNGEIYSETEGFMMAIQDEVIPTRNYCKHIMRDPNSPPDLCRKCSKPGETIDHIISACPVLAQSDYLKRHNDVAKIVHIRILQKYHLPVSNVRYFLYNAEPVMENQNVKVYYDRTIHTVQHREHNRPDITILDKRKRECFLIDIAIPSCRNMDKTRCEKLRKYNELAVELKGQWNLNKVTIVPIIISNMGLVPNFLKSDLALIDLDSTNIICTIQKVVILDTCHIVRKFMC